MMKTKDDYFYQIMQDMQMKPMGEQQAIIVERLFVLRGFYKVMHGYIDYEESVEVINIIRAYHKYLKLVTREIELIKSHFSIN